jgi:aminopeptidase YwaD
MEEMSGTTRGREMKRLLLTGALVIATCGALSAQKQTPATTNTAFDAAQIKSEIAYLASDELRGRGSGEPGNEKAAQYVAQAFQRSGLKPLGTGRQRDPNARSDGSGYYQPFTFVAGRVVGKGNQLVVTAGGKRLTYRPNQEFEPSSISAGGQAEGGLVFVGYGIRAPKANHDDYEDVDVKDKIVLLLAGNPKDDPHSPLADYADIYRKATTARDLGAKAVLVVLPKKSDAQGAAKGSFENVSDAGIPVLRVRYDMASSWFSPMPTTPPIAPTTVKNASTPVKISTFPAVVEEADAGKKVSAPLLAQVRLSADVKKIEKVTANVVGMIEGSDPVLKNEYIIIGAHVDHLGMGGPGSLAKSSAPAVHHGADDNASGAAGVMELARYFGRQKAENGGTFVTKGSNGFDVGAALVAAFGVKRVKRSVIFMCFSGEELGLLGSDWYSKHPLVPLEKTVAMLNMDMVGRLRDNKLTVIGSGTAKEWDSLLDNFNKSAGFALAKSESGFGASDQQSFYTKNVPVLFFFTGTHPQYHTPDDTVDLINAEGEAKVLRFVADCARSIADDDARPTFQRIATPDQNAPSRGLRVYFGSVPDYAAMVEGVQLNGVREGSPAEKAGLKAGDIIIKFGDKTIKNVYDYTYALQDYKPGDMAQVIVKRGEQTLKLNVTLAARPE